MLIGLRIHFVFKRVLPANLQTEVTCFSLVFLEISSQIGTRFTNAYQNIVKPTVSARSAIGLVYRCQKTKCSKGGSIRDMHFVKFSNVEISAFDNVYTCSSVGLSTWF